jgi:hypothetical protein
MLLVRRRRGFVWKLPGDVKNADEAIKGILHRPDVLSWLSHVIPHLVDCVFAARDESLLSFGKLTLNFDFDLFRFLILGLQDENERDDADGDGDN